MPPHPLTFVDTFDITLWLSGTGSLETDTQTMQIELYMPNGTVVQTVQTPVTFERTRERVNRPTHAPTERPRTPKILWPPVFCVLRAAR